LSILIVLNLFSFDVVSQNVSIEDSLYILKMETIFSSTLPDTVKLDQIIQNIDSRSALDSEYPMQYFNKAKKISDR